MKCPLCGLKAPEVSGYYLRKESASIAKHLHDTHGFYDKPELFAEEGWMEPGKRLEAVGQDDLKNYILTSRIANL